MSEPAAEPLSAGTALLVLVALIVVIAAFLGLAYAANVKEVWVSFLFLFYFGAICKAQMSLLKEAALGAVTGSALAWSLKALPLALGDAAGFSLFMALLLFAIFCQLVGWAGAAINVATFFFLTVLTVPYVQASFDMPAIALALAVGIVFWGGLVGAGTYLQKRKSAAAA